MSVQFGGRYLDPLEGTWYQKCLPLPKGARSPGTRDTCPPEGTWYQRHLLPPCEQIDRLPWKYYFPQTSFVGGNNDSIVCRVCSYRRVPLPVPAETLTDRWCCSGVSPPSPHRHLPGRLLLVPAETLTDRWCSAGVSRLSYWGECW